ncbi:MULTISPECIES: hypothetical protein [unclassified Rhizobacter]|uniref:hypothetical protein n=1 Tax=unclassified Rhizobacter TaxID=2640088 RepID=UPI0012F94374|nr:MULTISPECIES: hypothetical protein [unclassified Rhizobacter]
MDFIVDIPDPEDGRIRRFMKMGGRSRRWRGVAKQHGDAARANLDRAIELKLPVFGYEAEPDAAALERGQRAVKYFYLDRPHQLKGWIGLRLDDLEERLHIEDAFRQRGLFVSEDSNAQARLFELVNATTAAPGSPGSRDATRSDTAEEDEDGQGSEGNLTAEEYAPMALSLLVAHIFKQTDSVLAPVTYLQLASLLGRRNKHGAPWAKGLGYVLGRVTALIDSVSAQIPEEPPFLTSIVVLSSGTNAGLPDTGVDGRWPGYESLSRKEKRDKVAAEYQRILHFGSRWNEILRLVGLTPIPLPSKKGGGPEQTGWGGGESDAHKALKRYVHDHPEVFGAAAEWFAQEEYALRSGDELDVMFKSDQLWIGVEVKSRVSDRLITDYERGLYQVVKYRAVLEAQARIDRPEQPPTVRVLLALESNLPDRYRDLATLLDVQYVERVSMSAESQAK